MRILVALPLLLLSLSGCTSSPAALPQWELDEAPTWVDGEQWRYRVDANVTLTITVFDADGDLAGTPARVTDWYWHGMLGSTRNVTWRVWHEPETLAWTHIAVLRDDGTLSTEEDLSGCPVLQVFPSGTTQTPCYEEYAGMPIESTVYRTDYGVHEVDSALGLQEIRRYGYTSDFGDPVNGDYAPAIGHWLTLEINVPRDEYADRGRIHSLESYYNPRSDKTSP